jgi:hypothetical protein
LLDGLRNDLSGPQISRARRNHQHVVAKIFAHRIERRRIRARNRDARTFLQKLSRGLKTYAVVPPVISALSLSESVH